MKHVGQTNYTPVILSQPCYRYDDLHYDSGPMGNLYMPYDPNQTVTLQTPDSERNNIVSLTPGYYPVSSIPLLDSNFMNFYDPRRPGSCMVPHSPTSTKTESNNLVLTIPVYMPTPKLSKNMGLMTLNDPTAQCQLLYSLGSLGSAKTEGKNSEASMTIYNPSSTAQSLLPYSPRNGLNEQNPIHVPTPKTILSSRNPYKCVDDHVDDGLLKLINSIIKDAQEGNWSYLSQHSEPSKNFKPSCRQKLFKSLRDSIFSDITSINDSNNKSLIVSVTNGSNSKSLQSEALDVTNEHCVSKNISKKSMHAGHIWVRKSN